MKKEYNFSKGERGKFYQPDIQLNIPIYLDPEAYSFVERVAQKTQKDISTVVNNFIKADMQIANMVQ